MVSWILSLILSIANLPGQQDPLAGPGLEPDAQPAPPAWVDPTPRENPTGAGAGVAGSAAAVEHVREVVPFDDDVDPFEKLSPPAQKKAQPGEPVGDVLRLAPKVPPEPGEVLEQFPPREEAPPRPLVEPPALMVIRHAPDREADVVGAVTATFNHPMVPLAALADIDKAASPLFLSPMPEGRFQWLGTDTVAFQPGTRMPFATRFTVKVAKGTKSALGGTLGEDFSWTFDTPRPAVESAVPWDGAEEVEPTTAVTLTFNAAVDPAVVLKHVRLLEGKKAVPLVLGPPPEAPKLTGNPIEDEKARIEWSRTVVLKPKSPLKLATSYTLEVGKDLTCTEGPLPAGETKRLSFRTYEPLVVRTIRCGWDDSAKECSPGDTLVVEFNNQLAQVAAAPYIELHPAAGPLTPRIYGNLVYLFADYQPSTTYTVKVKPGVKDVHGQTNAKGKTAQLRFGQAYPFLVLQRNGLAVIEAKESHHLQMTTMNLPEVTFRYAALADGDLFMAAERTAGYLDEDLDLFDGITGMTADKLPLAGPENRSLATPLPLDRALAGRGWGIVLMDVKYEKRNLLTDDEHYYDRALVQVTDLGLTAAMSDDQVVVLVTRLSDGAPVAGATVAMFHGGMTGKVGDAVTDAQGMAMLPGPRTLKDSPPEGTFLLLARQGDDRAFLRLDGSCSGGAYLSSYSYVSEPIPPSFTGFVFTDRELYRPTDEVGLNLIARVRTHGPVGDLVPLTPEQRQFIYSVTDPNGTEVAGGELALTPFGTGAVTVQTDENAPLGWYQVVFANESLGVVEGSFQVQEFRTPEYKVSAAWLHGGENILAWRTVNAQVTGSYFFGAAMRGAPVEWRLTRQKTSYTPPGNPGFTFASFDPDEAYSPWERWYGFGESSLEEIGSGSAALDASGSFVLPLELNPGSIRSGPISFTLEAEVIDANRQSIAARSTIVAHRAERYVGIALDRAVVLPGERVSVSGAVTRLDGSRIENARVDVRLLESEWKEEQVVDEYGSLNYRWTYSEKEAGTCSFTTGAVPGSCLLVVPKGGGYVVRASTRDLADRPAHASVDLWCAGEEAAAWASDQEFRVEMIPDRDSYEPGETAKVLVQSSIGTARGMLMLSREGFVETRPFELSKGSAVLSLPIEERWMPSIEASVALVRGRIEKPGTTADDRGRPAFAYGSTQLAVSKAKRTVTLRITPSATDLDPGGRLKLDLLALDASGRPVQGNVALMVVDEGVLSLVAYQTPDPLSALYPAVAGETGVTDARPLVVPRIEDKARVTQQTVTVAVSSGEGGMGARAEKAVEYDMLMAPMMMREEQKEAGPEPPAGPEFAVRALFKSCAYFNGALTTDEEGRVSVEVQMPDNLTEFRVMAVAADEGVRFGAADTQVRTRMPLLVRPSLPRFLNFGDAFEAAAVVNNQTGRDTEVLVRCLAANATVLGDPVQKVAIASGEAREVRFQAAAGQPGPATFQFAVVGLTKKHPTDAAEVSLPTLIPATSEAFATYGSTETAVRQPLLPPADALPDYGGLEVSLSSTALTGLQDAVSYLVDYPYECTEQICSRILAIMAARPMIAEFGIGKASTPEEADKLVNDGLVELLAHQRGDGGFGFWTDSRTSWMYLTAYALFTMKRAEQLGYVVDQDAMSQAAQFLRHRLDHPHEWEAREYSSHVMALLALSEYGEGDVPRAHIDRLYGLSTEKDDAAKWDPKDMPLYAKAWLLQVLVRHEGADSPRSQELFRQLSNAAVEKASSIHFSESVTESMRLMMHSDDRTDAIVLSALLAYGKADPTMIDKVVRGLVRSRTQGRWSTTQANAYALLALLAYYTAYEKDEPDFKAWLYAGKEAVMGHEFKGRQMTIARSTVPMKEVIEAAAQDLVLAKDGPGRLYYRLGLRYAPRELQLRPEDRGFAVERIYLPEEGKENVTRRADGTWVVKAGTYVRVKLRVVAPDRRFYVAVVDPMPAGFEAVNEAFVTSATTRLGQNRTDEWLTGHSWRWWWWDWNPWEHEEMRDDRVQLFTDSMHGGVYEYTYTARATTLGTFVVPPTRAEEMYEPETFGRGATEKVVVE